MAIDHGRRLSIFSRRAAIVLGAKGIAFFSLLARLYKLQILDGDYYTELAEENSSSVRYLIPSRGLILDRTGKALASDTQNFQAILLPNQANQSIGIEKVLDRFCQVIPLTRYEIKKIYRSIDENHLFFPVVLREGLTFLEMSRISASLPFLPGVDVNIDHMRYYPENICAHVIGYVSAVSHKEVLRLKNPVFLTPGFRVGKNGLEKKYNHLLQGKVGKTKLKVDAHGRVLGEISETIPIQGATITTTFHLGLQKQAFLYLKKYRAGAIVVMDSWTGDILTMVSYPIFSPNAFTLGIDHRLWNQWLNDPLRPLLNRAISGQYAPASTFKPLTALSALENGIPESFTVNCKGYLDLWNQRFHCWKKHGHGRLTMEQGIMESCDVYFYVLGLKLGIHPLMNTAALMYKNCSLGLQGEKCGFLPSPSWKKSTLYTPWVGGDTVNVSIGQGYALVTPLQLAVSVARLVTGRKVQPRLCYSSVDGKKTSNSSFESLGFNEKHLTLVRQGMIDVVNNPRGTAKVARTGIPGWSIGGKTGTSQVKRYTEQEREKDVSQMSLPWKQRDHSLFVGFGPSVNPRYVMSVVIEHGTWGANAAAPIGGKLFRALHNILPTM